MHSFIVSTLFLQECRCSIKTQECVMHLRAQPITVSEEMLVQWDATELPFNTESWKIVFCCLLCLQNVHLCALNGCIKPPCVHLSLLPAEVYMGFEPNDVKKKKIKDIIAGGAALLLIRKHVPRVSRGYFYGHIVHISGVWWRWLENLKSHTHRYTRTLLQLFVIFRASNIR